MDTISDLKLVYQPATADGSDNAFAKSLKSIVGGSKSLQLVSPYLSLSVLDWLTTGQNFRLITDLQECDVRDDLKEFLERNQECIRTVRGVHAKVVLGDGVGLLGSANLTRNGFCHRFEMACEIRDGLRLEELANWFDELWDNAFEIDIEKIQEARERTLRRGAVENESPSKEPLPTTGKAPWSRRGLSSGGYPDSDLSSAIEELAQQLSGLTTSPEVARRILERFDEVFAWIEAQEHGLDPVKDERIHMNFGEGKSISITIGQRYVVWAGRKQGRSEFGMLLDDFEVAENWAERKEGVRSDAFTVNHVPDVPSFYWPIDDIDNLPEDVIESWQSGIAGQFARSTASSYRSRKRESLFRIVRNPAHRAEVAEQMKIAESEGV